MSKGLLDKLTPGMAIPFGGNRFVAVPEELAKTFKAGDRLIVVDRTGDLLHVPAEVQALASGAVGRAHAAFQRMGEVSDEAISAFFAAFAERLGDDVAWARISDANAEDV
ncbi:MAG TPA: glutamate-5-semialdehyde dehydrogenase, partial [Caulobacteraceae bacterium]|nr:glutamate-5-semialdehyde dehydrogenase [Caulobacteraceae bacterium]